MAQWDPKRGVNVDSVALSPVTGGVGKYLEIVGFTEATLAGSGAAT
jgi:hypothetical protein